MALVIAVAHYVGSNDVVPELCNLVDQPMYCRCDSSNAKDEVTDVTCYVGRKLPPDHIVFQSFDRQRSVVSLTFNAFGNEYKLDFVPTAALHYTPQIERLKIAQAELGDLKPHSFNNLTRLALLSLDSNEITSLDNGAITDLPRLKKLELGDNKLRRLRAGSLKNLPSLTHLFLERNKLEIIDDGAFEQLGSLKELELSDNSIEKLTEQSFRGLSHVTRLDLFRNKLTRLEARVFSGMPELAELDLKYNSLSEVDALAFEGLPQLTVLYMAYNRLRVLPAHMFRGAPNLVSVDLSQNQLLTLTWRTVQDLAKIHAESFDMSLTGNKFSCDCRLAWIMHLENITRNAKFRRELRHVKCEFDNPGAAPANMTGSKVVRLNFKQLGCTEDHERPLFGDRIRPTDRPMSGLSSTRPHDDEYYDVSDEDENDDGGMGGVGYPEENSLKSKHGKVHTREEEESSSVRNEVEAILSQQKAPEKEAAGSSKRHNANDACSTCMLRRFALAPVSFPLVIFAVSHGYCR